jgi:hypothetical protein
MEPGVEVLLMCFGALITGGCGCRKFSALQAGKIPIGPIAVSIRHAVEERIAEASLLPLEQRKSVR